MPALPAPSLPAVALAAAVGLAVGIAGYTFVYAKGGAYLGDDPNACAQCHVMQVYLDSWQNSPHQHVAVCNDCHTPANPIRKYVVKATNGFHHSTAFTSGNYPTNIRAREASRRVVEQQCRYCHADVVQAMVGNDESASCVRCHGGVGHL
jgi:cytochrome c nitrite reductase small subunit